MVTFGGRKKGQEKLWGFLNLNLYYVGLISLLTLLVMIQMMSFLYLYQFPVIIICEGTKEKMASSSEICRMSPGVEGSGLFGESTSSFSTCCRSSPPSSSSVSSSWWKNLVDLKLCKYMNIKFKLIVLAFGYNLYCNKIF